jgi:uncharacterized protein (DUF697 family)
VETNDEAAEAADANRLSQILDTIWDGIILGDSKWNPEKSCFDLAAEYRDSRMTPEECADNFINWQTAKAGAAGFALGLPGFAFMPLTIPADFVSVSYLQLRMVAVIGLLFGWDARSDQFRTTAYISLLGSAAGELARDFGIQAATRIAAGTIRKRISGAVLKKINSAAATRLVTKAGTKGVLNLTKMVPILGGIVGGGFNIVATRIIGRTAVDWLKDGPPPGGTEDDDGVLVDALPEDDNLAGGLAGGDETAGEIGEPRAEA